MIEFKRHLGRARQKRLLKKITHVCDDLIPANEILSHLGWARKPGTVIKQVPLEKIVGSFGRAQDFNLSFRPLKSCIFTRWQAVAHAYLQGVVLPPVKLNQLGETYFVEDGNHRISAALAFGWETIPAEVVVMDAAGLVPDSNCTRLGFRKPVGGSC